MDRLTHQASVLVDNLFIKVHVRLLMLLCIRISARLIVLCLHVGSCDSKIKEIQHLQRGQSQAGVKG